MASDRVILKVGSVGGLPPSGRKEIILDVDGTPKLLSSDGSREDLGGGAEGTQTPAPESVPESLETGELAYGWLPPPLINDTVIYASPDGDDAFTGHSERDPKATLYDAYLTAYEEGAGLVQYVHGTPVGGPVTNQGLWFRNDGRNVPGFLAGSLIQFKGVGKRTGGGFQYPGVAEFQAGNVTDNTCREFPPIWQAFCFNPMVFENMMPAGYVRQVGRVGWDYTRRDDDSIMKLPVLEADRVDGETTFTVTLPAGQAVTECYREDNVTYLTAPFTGVADYAYQPWRIGQIIRVAGLGAGFPDGDKVVTWVSNPVNFEWQAAYEDIGADDVGTAGGTIQSHACGSAIEGEYVEFQSSIDEVDFPSTSYRVVSHTVDTITVTDPYGGAANQVNCGVLLHQERAGYAYSQTTFINCAGQIDTQGAQAGIYNGPMFDVGATQALPATFVKCWLSGQEPFGEARDYDRQAAIFVQPGTNSNLGVNGTGIAVYDCNGSGGGVRVRMPGGSVAKVIQVNYTGESSPEPFPDGAAPSLDVLCDAPATVSVYARNVFNADNASAIPNVRCIGVHPDGIDVQHCGLVDIPAGGQTGDRWETPGFWSSPDAPDSPWVNNQVTMWAGGRISGEHPTGPAQLGACTARWVNQIDPPSAWVPGGGITPTYNVLARNGSMTATRLTAATNDVCVIRPDGGMGDVTFEVGGRFVIGSWVRSEAFANSTFALGTTGGITFSNGLSSMTVSCPYNADGWQWIAGHEVVTVASTPTPNVVIYAAVGAGQTLDLWGTTAFYVPPSIHDNDFFQHLRTMRHQPIYPLPPGETGTMDGEAFTAHGGLKVGAHTVLTVGVASGEITLAAANGNAIQIRDEAGNDLGVLPLFGWSENP